MTLSFTAAPTLPSLADPATFNDRALALFSWMVGTFIGELEDVDGFYVQGQDVNIDGGTLFVDISENRVGINNVAPAYALDITGTFKASSTATFGGSGSGAEDRSININASYSTLGFWDADGAANTKYGGISWNGGVMTFGKWNDTTGAATDNMYRIDFDASGATAHTWNIAAAAKLKINSSGHIEAGSDNSQTLGTASKRWSVVYAGTATINTSDVNEKTNISNLSAAEKRVAVAAKGLLKKFRYKTAVAEKGGRARIHFGIIAQELAAAFEAEGLDPWAYGVMCRDEWWEADVSVPAETASVETKPARRGGGGLLIESAEYKTVEVEPARVERRIFSRSDAAPIGADRTERWGVRYEELFAFILAAI